MPLYRDASNDRVYLIEPQFIKWLTTNQFVDMQQPYWSVPGNRFTQVCGAYDIPTNKIPTAPGLGWNYTSEIQANIALTAQRIIAEISAKIDATHTS